jgi:hypothetical protein
MISISPSPSLHFPWWPEERRGDSRQAETERAIESESNKERWDVLYVVAGGEGSSSLENMNSSKREMGFGS